MTRLRNKEPKQRKLRLEWILYAFAALALLPDRSQFTMERKLEVQNGTRTATTISVASEIKPRLVLDDCTEHEKGLVRAQTKGPFLLSRLTSCPDSSNWLEDFYQKDNFNTQEPFLAVNVGCNKGYDSLKLLRMGTRESAIKVAEWQEAAFKGAVLPACATKLNDLPLPPNASTQPGHVYCIEPMPATVRALQEASEATSMEQKGFRIVQAAMANDVGVAPFPENSAVGVEDLGIGSVPRQARSLTYVDVPMMTLDKFDKDQLEPQHGNQPIHVLMIDAEGYDFDVLMGANSTLSRVEYLEFEINKVGKWATQSVKDAIDYLDDKGFTCYYAGQQKLWRVTGCWQNHFQRHLWSNMACVNSGRKPDLAMKMEQVYRETIGLA